MVERIDAAVAGRRERVARLFGQQPGGGGVPTGVEAPEQAVLHNRHGAFASVRDPESRIVGCRVTQTGREGYLGDAVRGDIEVRCLLLEFRKEICAEHCRDIGVGLRGRKQRSETAVLVPSREFVSLGRYGPERTPLSGTHGAHVLRRADLLRRQLTRNRHAARAVRDVAVFHVSPHLVGVTVREIVAL